MEKMNHDLFSYLTCDNWFIESISDSEFSLCKKIGKCEKFLFNGILKEMQEGVIHYNTYYVDHEIYSHKFIFDYNELEEKIFVKLKFYSSSFEEIYGFLNFIQNNYMIKLNNKDCTSYIIKAIRIQKDSYRHANQQLSQLRTEINTYKDNLNILKKVFNYFTNNPCLKF